MAKKINDRVYFLDLSPQRDHVKDVYHKYIWKSTLEILNEDKKEVSVFVLNFKDEISYGGENVKTNK